MQLLNGFCVQINVDVYEVKRPLMFIPPNAKDCFEVNGIIWRVTSLHHCTSTSAAFAREPPPTCAGARNRLVITQLLSPYKT